MADAAPGPFETPDGFLTTSIAEVDPTSGTFRYRGVAVEDLIGRVPFGPTWGLLVDGAFSADLPPAEAFPLPVQTGDIRVDVQSALAQMAPVWGFRPLHDIDVDRARAQLAQVSALTLSFVAQSARGYDLPMIPQREVDKAGPVAGRFLVRWRGELDPVHVDVLDTYLVAAAEHGLTPATMTARVIASTGADVAACISGAVGAISGPLHGGSISRVSAMLDAAERLGDPRTYLHGLLDTGRRVMGFGHRWYHQEDPRATVLRRRCRELNAPRYEFTRSRSRRPPARCSPNGSHTSRWRRTSSYGFPRCWAWPTSRPTCSPRCSPAPAPPDGRLTSSSRSRNDGCCGPGRPTTDRPRAARTRYPAGETYAPAEPTFERLRRDRRTAQARRSNRSGATVVRLCDLALPGEAPTIRVPGHPPGMRRGGGTVRS